jgi:hypothetical protein
MSSCNDKLVYYRLGKYWVVTGCNSKSLAWLLRSVLSVASVLNHPLVRVKDYSGMAFLRWIIPPYTKVGNGSVRKDLMAKINCIPPQLTHMVYIWWYT